MMRWLGTRSYITGGVRCSRAIAPLRCHYRYTPARPYSAEKPPPTDKHDSNASNPPTSSEEEFPITKSELNDLGRVIKDDFANFHDRYDCPKHPIVLAHGLMGFDELRLAGNWLPGVQYWRGIKEALSSRGMEVITTSVPTTGSIKDRAEALHEDIKRKAHGEDVNIIAHSMGGLDSRYLISTIKPREYRIKSLTTIATPHRGSSAADWILREIGDQNLEGLFKVLGRMKIDCGAFTQLTRRYVRDEFNPKNLDSPYVRYFSYGASATPSIFSVFRLSHDIMMEIEGANDGLVSVASSKWGSDKDGYRGTLMGVTHLDLINWTNRLKRLATNMALMKQDFNAVSFYLAIADMLAKEGL